MRAEETNWVGFFEWIGGAEKSRALRRLLIKATATSKFYFFDSNMFIASADRDPIHLSGENHHKFGEEMAKHILRLKNRQN